MIQVFFTVLYFSLKAIIATSYNLKLTLNDQPKDFFLGIKVRF